MAREITFSTNVTIRKKDTSGNLLIDEKLGRGFVETMTGTKGPVPGAIQAKLAADGGTQVDLSQLTQPTICEIANLGPSDGSVATEAEYFEVGIWNAQDTSFSPILEVGAGEVYVVKLSRNLQEIRQGPGSGSAAAGQTARLMLIANSKAQNATVKAFEK